MKKILATAAALALALALAGCSSGELLVSSDDEGVHITAKGATDGSATGDITLEDGQGLCMNPAVDKGTISIKVTDGTGAVVYDDAVTGSNSILVPEATGSCDLVVTAKGAEGSVDVLAYNLADHAASDEALGEATAEFVFGDGYEAGTVSGDTYKNTTFGLSCTLPAGFEFAPAAQLAVGNVMAEPDEQGTSTYVDMMANRGADEGDSVIVVVQRFEEAVGGEATVNADDTLAEMVELVESTGGTVTVSEAGTTEFAGEDRPCIKVAYDNGETSTEIVQLYIPKGELLAMITVQAGSDETAAEILESFSAL